MTQNPIHALKITIYNTKHAKNTNMYSKNKKEFRNIETFRTFSTNNQQHNFYKNKNDILFCYISNFHYL